MKNCLSITGDVVFVFFSFAALCMLVATLMDIPYLEKSSTESGSGFHLLSCPELFGKQTTDSADFRNKYSDMHLSNESTTKLMTMLKESLEHSRVVHAGADESNESRFQRTISKAVEETVGDGREVDVNIPRRSDNKNLCDILKDIMDEQIATQDGQLPESGASEVTISILKVHHEKTESFFLRGARLIRSTPLIGSMMKMANVDGDLSDLVERAKQIDFGAKFREAATMS
jgi:hypothetical protein